MAKSDAAPVVKRKRGRPKGSGGRKPGSVNRISSEITALAQKFGPKAIRALAAILARKDASEGSVIAAANSLLDRGYGRPQQMIQHKGLRIDPSKLSDDELAAGLAIANRLATAGNLAGGDSAAPSAADDGSGPTQH